MKVLKAAVFLLFASLVVSCSSDDSQPVDNGNNNGNNNGNPTTGETFFNYKLDGQTVTIQSWQAIRHEKTFEVMGTATDGKVISLTFNQYGGMGDISSFSAVSFDTPYRTNFNYFKSNYFTFELVSLNETSKTVKVNFSGKVYDNEYDITSDFSTVEGSFQVVYTNVTPPVSGAGVSAKINNDNWYDSDSSQEGGFFSGDNVTIVHNNETKYSFGIVSNPDSEIGTYNITTSDSNTVILYAYNTTTNEDVAYTPISGTFKLDSKTVGLTITVISGTFTGTFKNPETNETVTVTNGTFTTAYDNY